MFLLCVGALMANGLGWLLMNYSFLNIAETSGADLFGNAIAFGICWFRVFREKITRNNMLGAILVVASFFYDIHRAASYLGESVVFYIG